MSKLSDFGGGAPEPDPEDQVKINLSEWFVNHGAEVFWEKRPSYGYRTFNTQSAERPDLLVVGEYRTFAIEVKIPKKGGEVYSGAEQTYRYWRRYTVEDVDEYYRADGDTVEPDAFLLSTGCAPDGRLLNAYDSHSDVCPLPIYDDQRMEWADPPVHFLPDYEYAVSEAITRMLWRFSTQDLDKCDVDDAPGIGTMLSKRLDGQQPDIPDDSDPFNRGPLPEPRALYKSYDSDESGGIQCQNWRWVQ